MAPIVVRRQDEFEIRQTTGMAAVARADQQRYQIISLNGKLVDGSDRNTFVALSCAGGQESLERASPRFQPPGDADAAFGMCRSHLPFDPNRTGYGTFPAHRCLQSRRRMHADAMRFHVPWNAHMLVRGIRDQVRRLRCGPAHFAPTLDEIIIGGLGDLIREVVELGRRRRSNPEIVAPSPQVIDIDVVPQGQPGKIELFLLPARFGYGGQTASGMRRLRR